MQVKYDAQVQHTNEELVETLEHQKEHDYKAYLERMAKEKTKITEASQIACKLLQQDVLSIETLNEKRQHLEDIPDDVE